MRYIAIACLTLFTLSATSAQDAPPAGPPVLTVHVAGETVEWDEGRSRLHVTGNVRILGYTDDPDSPRLAVQAGEVEVDLETGILEAHGAVRMRTDEAAFRGENLYFDVEKDQMSLTDAAVSFEAPGPRGKTMRGFFFADRVEREGADKYIVVNGIVTPADSPGRVQVGVSVDRLLYNIRTNRMTIYDGAMYFEGHRLDIPFTDEFSFTAGADSQEEEKTGLGWPGYSSREGIYWPLYRTFTPADSWMKGRYELRAGTRRYISGVVRWSHTEPDYDLGVYLSRDEYMPAVLDDDLFISRVPELKYTRHLRPDEPQTSLDAGVSLGRFHERFEYADRTSHTQERAYVFGEYARGVEDRRWREGQWWGARAEQSFYGNGTHFRDFSLHAGTGGAVGDDLNLSLTATKHFTSGVPTLDFDDVDIEKELFGTFDWRMSRRWSLHGNGNYDLSREALRDWEIRLSRRTDYLTYSIGYDFSDRGVNFRIDVNGLTGNTDPPDTRPVVTEEEVQLTPEWVHQEKAESFKSSEQED
ncbi:MAG: hypothetical protein ACLFWB_09485 [Armatimonadota bacterium]